jgi:hypothetical protein
MAVTRGSGRPIHQPGGTRPVARRNDIPVGSGAVPWSARLVATRDRPADGTVESQLPARCSLIDSPTSTHPESEMQLTAVSSWGDAAAAADLHG